MPSIVLVSTAGWDWHSANGGTPKSSPRHATTRCSEKAATSRSFLWRLGSGGDGLALSIRIPKHLIAGHGLVSAFDFDFQFTAIVLASQGVIRSASHIDRA